MSELIATSSGEIRARDALLGYWWYEKSEADAVIAELKNEIESMKVKFREFNDNVCKKIVDASRMMSAISQDAQMDFYEEFINEAK